jgi:hypothetical protein
MSTETVHPMVLKAARAYYFARWRETPEQSPEWWDACKQKLIAQMQAALTECGALECLEALDWCVAEINRDSPSVLNARKVMSAINGSAPE